MKLKISLVQILVTILISIWTFTCIWWISFCWGNIKPRMKYRDLDRPNIVGVGYFDRCINVGDTTIMGLREVIIIEK